MEMETRQKAESELGERETGGGGGKWRQRRHGRDGTADDFTSVSRVGDGQSLKGHGRHGIG